jgi:hypothetical protein
MTQITLYPPGEPPQKFETENFVLKEGVLSFTFAGTASLPEARTIWTNVPFLLKQAVKQRQG